MSLKAMAESLLKMHEEFLAKMDASSLEDVCGAIKLRVSGKAKRSYRDVHNVKLDISIDPGEDGFEIKWLIWDGEKTYESQSLQGAFAAWQAKWMNEPQLSLDVVAGALDPKMRKEAKAVEVAP